MIAAARRVMETQQLHQALNVVWNVVAEANRYFASEVPWSLAKTDAGRMGTVLFITAEVLRQVAILVQPFMPAAAARLLDLLAVAVADRDFATLGGSRRIAAGLGLPPPSPVFPRYVERDADATSRAAS
jgi:methionyl-tRNA synthetase